jgi:N6-adenosine-specific RNA methylase IME4/ParB-like chromosome segregation protein Spo0J
MQELNFHPIAAIFPLIEGQEFSALVDDVRKHGVREPIWLYDGQILDGRNRYKAAQEAGVAFETRMFEGTPVEAIERVWSLNRTRRHMTPSQAAIADARRNEMTDVYAAVRDAAKERHSIAVSESNKRRANAVPSGEQIPPMEDSLQLEDEKLLSQIDNSSAPAPKTRDTRAKAAGTNAKYIDLADKILKEHPELAADIESGKKTLSQVGREIRQQELSAKTPPPPSGKYRVIYADPPWRYNDAMAISKDGLGESYGPAEAHYPPMSITELCALPVRDIAEDDAVLFLWTTSPLLEDTFQIVKAWGFKYKSSFIWDKVKHNMGHYNSVRHEFLLVCTRGSCTPDVKKLFDSVQSIERSEKHSQKPSEFRQIIDTIYPSGSRIELFAREAADGWTTWGNEANGQQAA